MFLRHESRGTSARVAALLLPIVLIGCPEEKPRLPEFSERVHLRVSATWTADGECLDVVTETNLPEGTTFHLLGQQRHPPGYMEEADRLSDRQYEMKILVSEPRQEHKRVFCDSHAGGQTSHETGLLLLIDVGGPDSSTTYGKPHDYIMQRQEIGPKGEKLKGPLTRPTYNGTIAISETFVLPGTRYKP